MKCGQFFEIISALVDSEATALELCALQEHLKYCSKCRTELTAQYKLKEILSEYQPTTRRIDVSAKVMSKIASSREYDEDGYPAGARVRSSPPQWLVVAFVVIITVAAIFSAQRVNTAKDPAVAYASYVYEHIIDEDSRAADQ